MDIGFKAPVQDIQCKIGDSTFYYDYLYETRGDVLEFMKLTLRRYGYFPMKFIEELKKGYSLLCGETRNKRRCIQKFADGTLLVRAYDKLLQLLDVANKELDNLEQKGKNGENASYQHFLVTYKTVYDQTIKIADKERSFLEKHQNELDQMDMEEEEDDESEEEHDNVDEELDLIKKHILYCIKTMISKTYFLQRCKNYENQVRYKKISKKDFLELCKKKSCEIEEPAKKFHTANLTMCINTFFVVEQSGDMITYPEALKEILIRFVVERKWNDKLKEFNKLHRQNRKENAYTGKKPHFYRKSIAELEKSVFVGNEKYGYELCCAWNNLGGFTLSAVIVKFLFSKNMHSKAFLKNKKYSEHRERFYKALKRCCKVLVDFSKDESWLQGIELAKDVFYIYNEEFQNKKLSPDDICSSMEIFAEALEMLGLSLKEILQNYEYNGQGIGKDGFPRVEISQMWEDDREDYKNVFYDAKSEGYADGSNENLLYVNVLQIVFECVNADT